MNSDTLRKYDHYLTHGFHWGKRGTGIFPYDPTSVSPEHLGERSHAFDLHITRQNEKPRYLVDIEFHKMLYAGELDCYLEKRFRKYPNHKCKNCK